MLPPIHNFQPYIPMRTYVIREARETLWKTQAEAGIRTRKRGKTIDASVTEASPKKRRPKPTTKLTQIPNLPPDLAALLASALKSRGL